MLEIISYSGGKAIRHDLHNLKLPDGRLAHTLVGAELYRLLHKIDVAEIDAHTGHQGLLLAYSKHLQGAVK